MRVTEIGRRECGCANCRKGERARELDFIHSEVKGGYMKVVRQIRVAVHSKWEREATRKACSYLLSFSLFLEEI